MITISKKLRCCCTSLYRADAVRYGMMMLLLVVGLLFTAQPAVAQTSDTACVKEATGLNNPSCTANDVRIGSYRLVSPGLTSCDPTSNDPITVTIEATIESGPARYDVGIWINQDGGSAKSDPTGNNCFRDFLHPVASSGTNCEPDGPYYNADGDGCGDVHSVTTNPCSNAVTGPCTGGGGGTCVFTTYTFTVDILCRDSDGDGTADVGSCTSWDQGSAAVCSDELDTNPGTGSKCNCGRIDIIGLHTGCSVNSDCNDDNACTNDVCTVVGTVGTCTNENISCDDSDECTTDSCDPATGCTHGTVNCNDGSACTIDSCNPASGCVNAPISCDDGNVCTVDTCDPADGCHNVGSCASDTQIAPTATTCSDYRDGTAADLNQLLYGLKGGEINSVSPGVFFLYDGITLTSSCSTISVTESDGPWTQVIVPRTGQVVLYDAVTCNKVSVGSVTIDPATGNVTITGVDPGNYILGIKYDPTTLKGYTPPTASTTYSFAVSSACGASGSDSIDVNPKP